MVTDALQSSLKQTYQNLEILIVDNCSTDDTEQAVRQIISQDPRVKYFRHSKNLGMQRNFNACIQLSRGAFFLILCSDDMLDEDCVSTLVDALTTNPSAAFAAAARTFVNSNLEPIKVVRAYSHRRLLDGPTTIRTCIARGNFIGEPSAVMIRRDAAAQGFDVEYSQLLDYKMWLHLASRGSLVLLPEALCRIRQHSEQATLSNFRSGRLVDEKKKLFCDELAGIAHSLSFWCKFRWDLRMVASISRVRVFGGRLAAKQLDGAFYRPIVFILIGLTRAVWPLTRARIRHTHRNQ